MYSIQFQTPVQHCLPVSLLDIPLFICVAMLLAQGCQLWKLRPPSSALGSPHCVAVLGAQYSIMVQLVREPCMQVWMQDDLNQRAWDSGLQEAYLGAR